MKRDDEKCEEGMGHPKSERPRATVCVVIEHFKPPLHMHTCGKHQFPRIWTVPVAECANPNGAVNGRRLWP